MTESELLLAKEGLKLVDDALSALMQVNNDHIKRLASILHSVVWFGEMVIDGDQKDAGKV